MRLVALLALIALARPAIAQDTATKLEKLFPLTVGNSWTYRVTGQEDRFVVRVARQEMVGEQTCFRLDATLKDRVVATEHLAFTKDGLFRYRVDKEDVLPPVCVLKYPLPKSSRWGRQQYKVGDRSATASFSANTGELTVPAGKFKVITVDGSSAEGPGRQTRSIISYADGVGIVRQEIIEGKRPLVLELEKAEKEEEK